MSLNVNNAKTDEESIVPISFFANHKFITPTKCIRLQSHMPIFLSSPAFQKLYKFITILAISIQSKQISDISTDTNISPIIHKLQDIIKELNVWIDEIPPSQQPMRYGNKSYRLWFNRLQQNSQKLLLNLLPNSWLKSTKYDTNHSSIPAKGECKQEINNSSKALKTQNSSEYSSQTTINGILNEMQIYFLGSFGNSTRIDYGTGHELCFISFLFILCELHLCQPNDYKHLILNTFNNYILLMRRLQSTYFLEPAGTRGVWGLDDYQFLSFYFGASQLMDNPMGIQPTHILEERVLISNNCEKYLYLSSIAFILKMKTGLFSEHSPLLYNISGVKLWAKVKTGLLKMYVNDVLKKFPVIQHFFFGTFLSIELLSIEKQQKIGKKVNVINIGGKGGGSGSDDPMVILRRKKALIAKKNAEMRNMKSGKKRKSDGKGGHTNSVVTSAPWARNSGGKVNEHIVTQAPWIKKK